MGIIDKIDKIAEKEGMRREELLSFSLIAYFTEKKRMCMEDRLGILERYGVKSAKELEEKIKRGDVKEHPAWEDLITVENLGIRIKEISDDIRTLQETP